LLEGASIIILDIHPSSVELMRNAIKDFLDEAIKAIERGSRVVALSARGIKVLY